MVGEFPGHVNVFISSAVQDTTQKKKKWWTNLLAHIKVFSNSAVQDIKQKRQTNKNGGRICWHILKCLSVLQFKTPYKKTNLMAHIKMSISSGVQDIITKKQTKMAGEFPRTY